MSAGAAVTTARTSRKQGAVMTRVVIKVDHVYLPVGPEGNVVTAWPASNVFTSKVLKGTELQVPADLAQFLADRGQAAIATPAKTSGDLSSFAKATEDKSSVAPERSVGG